jgi:hypothetical protein
MFRRFHRWFLVLSAFLGAWAACSHAVRAQHGQQLTELPAPIAIYSHDSASAQASGATPLSEEVAMNELDELVRLKNSGVHFDYDLIGPSGFTPDSGYRTLRAQDWPDGPGAWIDRCRAAGIGPGLRLAGNTVRMGEPAPATFPPQWKSSLDPRNRSLSLFEGGFLPDLMTVLQFWYDRGVRLFQFDSIDLTAATPASSARLSKDEIVARNAAALNGALIAFRRKNRDAVLLVLTGPDAFPDGASMPRASAGSIDGAAGLLSNSVKLGAFQVLSLGRPRAASAPQANVVQSIEIENDGRVRRFEQIGVPLRHIDAAGFTVIGIENSGHHAPLREWKGPFLLAMARGGWVNSIHGDLHRIQEVDAFWMARVQKLFFNLQAQGHIHSFGASPGSGQPYGFAATTRRGSVFVVMNPGLNAAQLALPPLASGQPIESVGRIQFRDAGFTPRLHGGAVTLGPGQMAMIGYGAYAQPAYNFGVEQDVVIPNSIQPVDADFQSDAPGDLEADIDPPIQGVLRVVVLGRSPGNPIPPIAGGDPLNAERLSRNFTFDVTQGGRSIPVRLKGGENTGYEAAFTGPIWLVAEIDVNDLTPGLPVSVQFRSKLGNSTDLEGSAYQVVY